MRNFEELDIANIVGIRKENGSYFARIELRDGKALPGQIIANPYRIVEYGFVSAEGMPGFSHLGEIVPPDFQLYDVRIIAAFVRALSLTSDWAASETSMSATTLPIPDIGTARAILSKAKIPVHPI